MAGVLLIRHGACATYQIGWSSKEGRKVAAINGLLWQARRQLFARHCHQLDLGGVPEGNKGLEQFKKGTGARFYEIAGHYK